MNTSGKPIIVLFFFIFSQITFSQEMISGIVLNNENKQPIEYVNIGIPGKEIGTVSNQNGNFSLQIPAGNKTDTLLFSCMGFEPLVVNLKNFSNNHKKEYFLNEKTYNLSEITVKPKRFKTKILGITTKNKNMVTGFEKNKLGYESGVLMKSRKSAFLKKINLNISDCRYDSVFYRVNIYQVNGKMDFENILHEPIFLNFAKSDMKDNKISLNIQNYNIVTHGDFLVTLELVKDLGEGGLWFPMALFNKTYVRKTSQANWTTAPIGFSLSVEADVEQ